MKLVLHFHLRDLLSLTWSHISICTTYFGEVGVAFLFVTLTLMKLVSYFYLWYLLSPTWSHISICTTYFGEVGVTFPLAWLTL